MNKRIRELAQQAFQPINDISTEGVADRYTFEQAWFQMYNEKFAELIVQECINTLNEMHVWQSVNNQNYPGAWHDAVDAGIENIKQHFGVK